MVASIQLKTFSYSHLAIKQQMHEIQLGQKKTMGLLRFDLFTNKR